MEGGFISGASMNYVSFVKTNLALVQLVILVDRSKNVCKSVV